MSCENCIQLAKKYQELYDACRMKVEGHVSTVILKKKDWLGRHKTLDKFPMDKINDQKFLDSIECCYHDYYSVILDGKEIYGSDNHMEAHEFVEKSIKDAVNKISESKKPYYIIEEKQNGQWKKITETNNIVSLLENMKTGRRCIDTRDNNWVVEW